MEEQVAEAANSSGRKVITSWPRRSNARASAAPGQGWRAVRGSPSSRARRPCTSRRSCSCRGRRDSDSQAPGEPGQRVSASLSGQLTAVGNAGGNGTENFAYAGTGQDQVLSDGTAAGITYGLAGQDGQPEVQSCTAHATGTSAPTYVLHDQQGTPLGMMRNGNVYAFITDNLGSVTHLIDTSGATDAAYAYDPYGNQVSQSGGEDLLSLLGYAGALTHPAPDQGAPATGYTHLGNRWQNPATATFRQQDNINKLASPASANTYTYAADNPANYTDPTERGGIGSCIIDLTTGIGLGIFGVVSGFFGIAPAETGVGLALGRPAYTQASPVLPSASTRLVTIAEMRHETAQTSTAMREMNRRKRVRISIALYVVAGICVIAGILFGVISNDTSGILISLIPGAAIAFSATSVLLGAKKR